MKVPKLCCRACWAWIIKILCECNQENWCNKNDKNVLETQLNIVVYQSWKIARQSELCNASFIALCTVGFTTGVSHLLQQKILVERRKANKSGSYGFWKRETEIFSISSTLRREKKINGKASDFYIRKSLALIQCWRTASRIDENDDSIRSFYYYSLVSGWWTECQAKIFAAFHPAFYIQSSNSSRVDKIKYQSEIGVDIINCFITKNFWFVPR